MVNKIENSYLCCKNRLEVVESYLSHEKNRAKNKGTADKVNNSTIICENWKDKIIGFLNSQNPTKEFLKTMSIEDQWLLFHLVSYGIFNKKLYNCVGHPNFTWRFEEKLSIDKCKFESPIERIPKGTIFKDALVILRENNNSKDCYGNNDANKDPIIGREENGHILVHDGNGRLYKIAYDIVFNNSSIRTVSIFIGKELRGIKTNEKDKKIYEWAKENIFKDCLC
jgi:hypothetical protein